jgi:hypothetical protein
MRSSPVMSGASRRIAVPAIRRSKGSTSAANPRASRMSSQRSGSIGSPGNCRIRSCHSSNPSALFTRPAFEQHGQLKETHDWYVHAVALLLGTAKNPGAPATHPCRITAGEEHQCVGVRDVSHFAADHGPAVFGRRDQRDADRRRRRQNRDQADLRLHEHRDWCQAVTTGLGLLMDNDYAERRRRYETHTASGND